MNLIIENILTRRSIRKFKPQQIAQEELSVILNAGAYAPSAGARQGVILLASQNDLINKTLGKINCQLFRSKVSGSIEISKDQPSIADDITKVNGFYDAPTVIVLFGLKDTLYATADCSVAAQNIMLAANSFNIGSCMIMRAEDTFSNEFGQDLLRKWEISDNYQPKAFVILGYPSSDTPLPKQRKENRIKLIR